MIMLYCPFKMTSLRSDNEIYSNFERLKSLQELCEMHNQYVILHSMINCGLNLFLVLFIKLPKGLST